MKTIKLTALILGLLSLCGCSQNRIFANYRELDQTELIQTMGMDKIGDEAFVTVATGVEEKGSFTIFTGKAATIANALSQIHTFPTKRYLFFGHTTNLLIGSDMLSRLGECFDFIERSADMRLDTPLFIVRNGSARDLMREAKVGEARVSELLQPLTDESNLGSDNHVFTTKEIVSVLSSSGYALAYAVEITRDPDKTSGDEANVIPAGYGIIKNGGIIGYVDYSDCLGVNLIINQAVNGILEVDDGLGGYVSLSLANSKSYVEGEYSGNRLQKIILRIKTSANIEQMDHSLDISKIEILEKLEAELANILTDYCQRAINISKETETDFLGFGKRLHIDSPLKFEKNMADFQNVFKDIPIEIRADALIERTYDILQTGGTN